MTKIDQHGLELNGQKETEKNDTETRECLLILVVTPEWEESLL